MKRKSPEHRLGWRGGVALTGGLAAAAALLLGIGALGRIGGTTSTHHEPTPSPLSNEVYAYWYCWDAGAPRPHHFGAPVRGDHVCSEDELRGQTVAP